MGYQEWDDLGDKIQDIIDSAINEGNYRKLSQNINQTVNKAINTGSDALRDALDSAFNTKSGAENPEHNARAYETHKNHGYQQPPFGKRQKIVPEPKKETALSLYGKTGGERVKGILMTTFGGILTGGMGIGFLIMAIASTVAGLTGTGPILAAGLCVTGAATAAGAVLLGKGCGSLVRLGRFQRYIKTLGQHTYCNFEQLSRAVGKPVKYVKKDIKAMISRGWFLEGHVDKQETCLITSNETYRQYVATQEQLEQKAEAEAKAQQQEKLPKDVQEVLDKGNEYLVKIRRSNDAIPGEEISRKISHMELIVQKIFERAKEHPEIIPDLNHFMDYYLPMTVKLLDAYEDMDSQPVAGENIRNSKKEIEGTIDTLNIAFEKILDSIFQDTAWDVSSDISVLHTVLAQEGLAEDDFAKMKREAAEKAVQ
ncbi:5-bromo-4-chloroindolyl phosphate hydrolysis family protein [Ruminococcus sp. 5_1_39BFAA]|uniref:5-bromo-4-chloroindolyl phosphate hydrolysis family protein n=1 Tax=Ruminococcus sp. 5_1_39BFAA TaxID=457412 RepID=UPI0035651F50